MRFPFALVLLITSAVASASAVSRWHWEDRFSARESADLKRWITDVTSGMQALVGPLPYAQDVHFHRSSRRGEPVPWANTDKRRGRAVHFHVDLSHGLNDFYSDWTASHELAHLMFPYVGSDGRWFAEGIASYLQYQIMYAGDAISWDRATARIRERFERAGGSRSAGNQSIVELSTDVRGAYVRLYWGGAAYFLLVDQQLHETRGIRLVDVIAEYLQCCYRSWGRDEMDMLNLFNRISDTTIFTDVYTHSVARPGFPETDRALEWLSQNPPPMRSGRLHDS